MLNMGMVKVIMCIDHMYNEDINVNDVSFIFTLKAYVSIGAIVRGQEIHSMIIKKGLERENLLGNILIDMYAKCGLLMGQGRSLSYDV